MSEPIKNIPGTDHIDPEWALKDFAGKMSIPISMIPQDVRDSLTFICTSDDPR